jgi:hypothetical protein
LIRVEVEAARDDSRKLFSGYLPLRRRKRSALGAHGFAKRPAFQDPFTHFLFRPGVAKRFPRSSSAEGSKKRHPQCRCEPLLSNQSNKVEPSCDR